jgi:hypothetical protein
MKRLRSEIAKEKRAKVKRPIPQYWPYLIRVGSAECGLIVLADDLAEAGMLISCGFAVAENDYEGPRIRLSDKGRKLFESPRR